MSKFKKQKSGDLPAISTASLPDIVFMLLFFFMTVTVMRDNELKVKNNIPYANQIDKLNKKDPVIFIYAGKPSAMFQSFGTEPKIQMDDKFLNVSEVGSNVLEQRDGLPQELKDIFFTALKIDEETNMGLISDIKQELRKINALKLMYITKKGDPIEKNTK